MRWEPSDPASLSLLDDSPVTCLLLDQPQWTPAFLKSVRDRKLTPLAEVHNDEERKQAIAAGLEPVMVTPRASIRFDGSLIATGQGLWPGVKVEKNGAVEARPSGAPWIETNSGFLRFVKAVAPAGTTVWMVNRPPNDLVLGPERYVQAIADAAMSGARWVVSLNKPDWDLLLKRDPKALAAWNRISKALRFYESNRAFVDMPDYSGLVLLQDARSGALMSGSILDMISAKHIPAEILPISRLGEPSRGQVRLLLNIDPAALTPEQKEQVKDIARRGATVVNGPPGWNISLPGDGSIVFGKEQLKQLDDVWREINGIIGRRNFGVRVFGAPSMLSNLKSDGSRIVLHLVNYSNYPVENITLQLPEKYKSAAMLTPQGPRKVEAYDTDEGTSVDIPGVEDVAILVLEPQPKR